MNLFKIKRRARRRSRVFPAVQCQWWSFPRIDILTTLPTDADASAQRLKKVSQIVAALRRPQSHHGVNTMSFKEFVEKTIVTKCPRVSLRNSSYSHLLSATILLLTTSFFIPSAIAQDARSKLMDVLTALDAETFTPKAASDAVTDPAPHSVAKVRDQSWYKLLDPLIMFLSRIQLVGKENWLRTVFAGVHDGNIPSHEGSHIVANTRYKEWWYFDTQLPSGHVVSGAIVLSLVRPHCFVWIYDPETHSFENVVEYDGKAQISEAGTGALSIACGGLEMRGESSRGYRVEIASEKWNGHIAFADPLPGRAEVHWGQEDTVYALYQLPGFETQVQLHNHENNEVIAGKGAGYHDHWWGIMNRYTSWAWNQIKFTDGSIASFYDARYGASGDDHHRYAWMYRPGTGYKYFNEDSLRFTINPSTSPASWSISAAGEHGSLQVTSQAVAHRRVSKPLLLGRHAIGNVIYHQYPVHSKAMFTLHGEAEAQESLSSRDGLLEWDWRSIW